jgi:hypothetical protein
MLGAIFVEPFHIPQDVNQKSSSLIKVTMERTAGSDSELEPPASLEAEAVADGYNHRSDSLRVNFIGTH